MDRLRMLLTLTTASLLAALSLQVNVAGQTSTAVTGEFVVAGDVIQPATYPLPSGQPLTLQQAINAAGPASDSVMVMIVRPSQAEALWTHALSQTSTDPGPQVVSGDVLVVYSTGPLTRTVHPNAVLLNQKATVLSLHSNAGEVIRLADVLTVSGLPHETASLFRRSSMRPGRGRQSGLTITESVEHGDVLRLMSQNSATTASRQGFAPQVSEWSSSVITTSTGGIPASPAVPAAYTAQQPPLASLDQLSLDQPSSNNMISDSQLSNGQFNNDQLGNDQLGNDDAGGASAEDSDSQFAQPETGLMPAATNDVPADNAADSRNFTNAESFENPEPLNSEEAVSLFRSDAEEMAPLPPEEVPVNQVENAMNFWNLAFVAGLLVAGGLIIAGWIKSEAELKQLEQTQAVPLHGFADQKPVSASKVTDPKVANQPEEFVTIKNSLAPLDDLSADSEPLPLFADPTQTFTVSGDGIESGIDKNMPLVASHEWRSRDWQDRGKGSASEVPSVPQPVVQSVPQPVIPIPLAAVTQPEPLVTKTQPEPLAAASSATPVYHDLNDLIENRLPVELREAQLPLRINLFGKAAGPRRLRVDAAHTQLAGPHMNMSGERRRSEPAAASASGTASGMQANSGHQSEPDAPHPMRPQRGSLDRALNYLHEQGE